MSLRKTTERLIGMPDVAHWLRVADAHIQSYNKLKSRFILPAEHELVKPVVEAFANDTGAFAEYIRALRDAVSGAAKPELNALYRTVSLRALQVTRRSRVRRAVTTLVPQIEKQLKREVNYDEQMLLGRFIEQVWGALRLDAMSHERDARRLKHLDAETRNEILADFWSEIDKKLDKGVVDLGEKTIHDLAAVIE